MEVHHHSHHGPGGTKKKWTHYIWEFLMLFLAVFCGFLAEYQLEHKIERERERQYMKSMVDDLMVDTANLNSTIAFVRALAQGMDSLQQNLFNADDATKNAVAIYRQNGKYIRRFAVNFSDQTATQLRNAGTLRLIGKRNVVIALSNYWRGIKQVESIEQSLDESVDEIASVGDHIINRSKYIGFSQRDPVSGLIEVYTSADASLLSADPGILISYANKVNRLKSRIENFYIGNLHEQKKEAKELIELIKEEYHLK